jgi:tellurite resistance protein TehA-like permease
MGTGIVSILLFTFPWKASWLYHLSLIVFVLNLTLFIIGLTISLLRYTLWPAIWSSMLSHPNQSLYIAAVPMSLSTIVNMIVFVCVPAWGNWTIYLAWALWMVDAILSLLSAIYMPFQLIRQHHDLHLRAITALQLFPVVATVVCAASGGVVASVLPHTQHALATLIASYVLWGVGVPTALLILVMYFHRLVVHKLPSREVIVSSFLPLGPLNMGAFGIMQLGDVAKRIFPETHTVSASAGNLAYDLGVFVGLILWAFSLPWFFFAVASIHQTKRFPFNMGWWGFTFPIGTFALSSGKLAEEVPSLFFRVIQAVRLIPSTMFRSVRGEIKADNHRSQQFVSSSFGSSSRAPQSATWSAAARGA